MIRGRRARVAHERKSRLTSFAMRSSTLQMLDRALSEGDSTLEKKARRAILRQTARDKVYVRQRAARVLAEQRRKEQIKGPIGCASPRSRTGFRGWINAFVKSGRA